MIHCFENGGVLWSNLFVKEIGLFLFAKRIEIDLYMKA